MATCLHPLMIAPPSVSISQEEETSASAKAVPARSFPDTPHFRLLEKDAARALEVLHDTPTLMGEVSEMLRQVSEGSVSPSTAHEVIAGLRLLHDMEPDALCDLEGSTDPLVDRISPNVRAIVRKEQRQYTRALISAAYQRLYGKSAVQAVSLPLSVARCLLCKDGTLNLGLARVVQDIFLPPRPSCNGVEEEVSVGVSQLIEEESVVTDIESLHSPASEVGARIVRATLSLSDQEEVTAYHTRLVCCAALLTWIRQREEGDCYARALLSQLQRASFRFLVHDFRALMESGSLSRCLDGRTELFFPLEELLPAAGKEQFLKAHLRSIRALPAVKRAFEALGAGEEQVCSAIQKVRKSDGTTTLADIFSAVTSDVAALRRAHLYLEAPGQNIVHQMLENAIVSFLVHPGICSVSLMDLGECLEMIWRRAIGMFVNGIVGVATEARGTGACRGEIERKMRLFFSPQKACSKGPFHWTVCSLENNAMAVMESYASLGGVLQPIIKKYSAGRGQADLSPHAVGVAFVERLQSELASMAKNPKVSDLTIQEHPISFPCFGHHIAALTSRYFSGVYVGYDEIPCDGEAIVKWAASCQDGCGVSPRVSFCVSSNSHAFRLLPQQLSQRGDEKAFAHASVAENHGLYSKVWDLIRHNPLILKIVVYTALCIPEEATAACAQIMQVATIEEALSSLEAHVAKSSCPTNATMASRFLLVLLALAQPAENFSSFSQVMAAFRSVQRKTNRGKPRAPKKEVITNDQTPSPASAAEFLEGMARTMALSPRDEDLPMLAEALQQMVRDDLFAHGVAGTGMLLHIGDSNYRAEISGMERRAHEFLWYNPWKRVWNRVSFRGRASWAISNPTRFRVVTLVDELNKREVSK